MSKSKSKFSSIGRKVLMALSGFFLMFFLVQHLSINMLSVISPDTFNSVSQFMGTNFFVQGPLQIVLMSAVLFHFIFGIYLEYKNSSARSVKYAKYKGSANASWMSRNMIISGLVVLAFLALHFADFWIHEMDVKYIQGDMSGLNEAGELRYYEELVHSFQSPIKVGLYIVSFFFLALHLMHGFQSSFQSVGFNSNKYTPMLKTFGNVFAIVVPALFAFIALFHHFNH